MRLLFSCAGRRVELITAFIRAARSLHLKSTIHCADAQPRFAAAHVADKSHQIPPAHSDEYIPRLLEVVQQAKIDLLIPLLDLELQKLADARGKFRRQGCHVLVSSPQVVNTCQDKLATFEFLARHGIDTPQTWLTHHLADLPDHRFPYFFKPRAGSASQGSRPVCDLDELRLMARHHPDAIVQEFVEGVEHTLDIYTGFDGIPRCVVPRQRIEVRGGEVTRARTVCHPGIMQVGAEVVKALRECVGLITIQVILTPDGRIRVIEINPRFGGGVPLAIKAGANFPKWLLMEWLGRTPSIRFDGFRNGLVMLRYHQSFFEHASDEP